MPRVTPSSVSARESELTAQERAVEAEVARLEREEEQLLDQLRQARQQVRYYEALLRLLRREWGRGVGLHDVVRRL